MELSYMLNQMCHEVLSNADVNAIRKARGFTKSEIDSRSQLESFYLASIGLEAAMLALSPAEIACLHLINYKNEGVDLTFFERIYGSDRRGERYYYGAFTQQYQATYKAVKQNLLRRGLLVMAELRTRADNTKMERWRFRFPPEFAPYLPPQIPEPAAFEIPGDDRSAQAQRDKVLEALDASAAKTLRQNGFQSIVYAGDFTLGGAAFQPRTPDRVVANGLAIRLEGDDAQRCRPIAAPGGGVARYSGHAGARRVGRHRTASRGLP